MKKNLIYSIILLGGLVFAAASIYAQEPTSVKPVTEQQCVKYTCTMHPDVVMDKPGKCPKCGMELVEKKIVYKEKACSGKDTTKEHHEHMTKDTKGCMKEHHMAKDSTSMK